MRASFPNPRRPQPGPSEGVDYDPSEHAFENLIPGARATVILCVLFLMLLVII
jgi:hypothetical protein